jgi:PKHD-type hydroxylase
MLLIIPNVLNKEQVELVLREIGDGAYEDGRVSAGDLARDVKKNLQIKRDAAAAQKCAPMILDVLRRNSVFFSIAFPHKINGPIFNRYDVGMTYGLHVDNALMGEPASIRSDVSATLFLSAPESYDGGELILSEHQGERRIKLPQGSMVVYASTNAHRVEPVTRGTRLAAIFWIQSMIREEAKRDVLFDLNHVITALHGKVEHPAQMALSAVYHNLLRMWAET